MSQKDLFLTHQFTGMKVVLVALGALDKNVIATVTPLHGEGGGGPARLTDVFRR